MELDCAGRRSYIWPPDGLNASGKFPVGKALELERALIAAKDPRESI
jgi:hypothetical protein